MTRSFISGSAGIHGRRLSGRVLTGGHEVTALDNFGAFDDPALRWQNVGALRIEVRCWLVEATIRGHVRVEMVLGDAAFDVLAHLAGQSGVRPSIEQPLLDTEVDLDGTMPMLELARRRDLRRFVIGSSSSSYGNPCRMLFSEGALLEQPISLSAATKRGNDLLCHTYPHYPGLSLVLLRFFTVYGPWQRPDLAMYKFVRLMLEGRSNPMSGDGRTRRDCTYVDDILQVF